MSVLPCAIEVLIDRSASLMFVGSILLWISWGLGCCFRSELLLRGRGMGVGFLPSLGAGAGAGEGFSFLLLFECPSCFSLQGDVYVCCMGGIFGRLWVGTWE